MALAQVYNAATQTWNELGGGIITPSCDIGFSAHKNSVDQTSVTQNAYVKLTFPTEEWDNGGFYDASLSRFQPKVAGKYLLCSAAMFNFNVSNYASRTCIFKNGLLYKQMLGSHSGDWANPPVSCIVNLNGTTDYVESYGYHNYTSPQTVHGGSSETFFQGMLIQPALMMHQIPVDLTGATSDYPLQIDQTAHITYSNATSVPLRISTGEGLYELTIIGNNTINLYTGYDAYLLPNNSVQATGSIDGGLIYTDYTTTDATGNKTSAGYKLEKNAFFISAYRNLMHTSKISTFTVCKSMTMITSYMYGATQYEIGTVVNNWFDTTTVWSSLGTITFPFAQSGKIVIKRIF